MTISAKVICDSMYPFGTRLTTMELRYPRFIHAEFMTHRVFSRNASSSRAIPVKRLIKDIQNDPVYPSYWGKNQSGMQADQELDITTKKVAMMKWVGARELAVRQAESLHKLGAHKQIVNRVLEPFSHINVLVTSTEWQNFFDLRLHKDAQPEIQELARKMKVAMINSETNHISHSDWHLPYISSEDLRQGYGLEELKTLSVARCASVSYKTVDGKPMTYERAKKIFDKLTQGEPFHASPFEHVSTPCPDGNKLMCRNFDRWAQYRAMLELGDLR